MPHEVQVQKVVLLPRFTSFSGATTFHGPPMNVRAFASALITVWTGDGIAAFGVTPTFTLTVEESPDLEIWNTIETFTPTAGTEDTHSVDFSREWIRVTVVLTGTSAAFTCWAVGEFVTRAARSARA